jgi:hypothetical protein
MQHTQPALQYAQTKWIDRKDNIPNFVSSNFTVTRSVQEPSVGHYNMKLNHSIYILHRPTRMQADKIYIDIHAGAYINTHAYSYMRVYINVLISN